MIYLLTVSVFAIAALGYVLWRQDRRIDRLLSEWGEDRREAVRERQILLDSLPGVQGVRDFEPPSEPPYVGFDDDAEFHRAKEAMSDGNSS